MDKGLLRSIVVIGIIILNIGLDQYTKSLARAHINHREYIEVVGETFVLTKVQNAGAFLGLGNNWPAPVKWLFLNGIPLLILAYGLYVLLASSFMSRWMILGLSFAIGGGFGNMYDRLVFGSVTDFMHLDFGLVRTGIFNVADMAITVGVVMIFIDIIRHRKRKVPQKPTAESA